MNIKFEDSNFDNIEYSLKYEKLLESYNTVERLARADREELHSVKVINSELESIISSLKSEVYQHIQTVKKIFNNNNDNNNNNNYYYYN